jgi:hypothetical protein
VPTAWSDLSRPVLRDGLRVVRRDDQHLQIGLDAPQRLVLADLPGLHEALTHLHRPPPAPLTDVVDNLVTDGWVVDAAASAPGREPSPVDLTVDAPLADQVVRSCAAAGLTIRPVGRSETASAPRLVVTRGEPARSLSDTLVRDDVPHLWLAVLADRVRVGPFVEPGRTPCLRCLDAHLGDVDPRRATVLHQLDELPPPTGVDPDPCLAQLGISWAVRDVVRFHQGATPALRATTITITADLEFTPRPWLRHPHCGCAWG